MNTSFGSIEHILKIENKPVAEYLVFEKEGRKHKHLDYETFVVLSGEGQVVRDQEFIDVKEGDIVTIPPKTTHWMIPKQGQILTGILWYHNNAGQYL